MSNGLTSYLGQFVGDVSLAALSDRSAKLAAMISYLPQVDSVEQQFKMRTDIVYRQGLQATQTTTSEVSPANTELKGRNAVGRHRTTKPKAMKTSVYGKQAKTKPPEA